MFCRGRDGAAVREDEFDADVECTAVGGNSRGMRTSSLGATTLAPPGGATVVDFEIDRPGRYVLVDHALSRIEHGLAGYLLVDGPSDDDLMHSGLAKR